MNSLEALLILSSVRSSSSRQMMKLIERFTLPERVFEIQTPQELSHIAEIPLALAADILSAPEAFSPGKMIEACAQKGISILHILAPEYPRNLLQIYDPPLILYVKGRLMAADEMAIGIVGSRRASAYGVNVSTRFSCELAEQGITIVSGLALGIDKAAHEGALRAQGRTIAVLGCGVDVIYPEENKNIYEQICRTGSVLSEFPPGALPMAFHFPKRNRIIAGLSLGILVVEAGERSGSLITARLGMEEGREVYAVPGRIDSYSSAGTHRLIQSGARLVTRSQDILEDLYPVLKRSISNSPPPELSASDHPQPAFEAEFGSKTNLSENEKKIWESMANLEEVFPDELCTQLDRKLPDVLQGLTQLELKGMVVRQWGGSFKKTRV
ncbi:MAG: DNA-protecting protein DprA [Candidatus Omnitrophica bacterium]|nr:DNA-protecting protein DprA [Candidatus Omnitrophota bacterium]